MGVTVGVQMTILVNRPTAVLLTHFMPLISFNTPSKHQKTSSFLLFSGLSKEINGIKWVNMLLKTLQKSIFLSSISIYLFKHLSKTFQGVSKTSGMKWVKEESLNSLLKIKYLKTLSWVWQNVCQLIVLSERWKMLVISP